MIKPNVVIGGYYYRNTIKGVVTTTAVLEEIIIFLKNFGCSSITIGEGSVLLPELGVDTLSAFQYAGITDLAQKQGVNIIDFYSQPFNEVSIEGESFQVSSAVLESDFVINVPVLKTHNQTKVSLSIKNLKGALSFKSKKRFHNLGLERHIAALGAYIRPQLNIIDGLYTVNNGPVSPDWRDVGVVLAGRDPLAVDVVGTSILGHDPRDVGHLVEYANLTGSSLDLEDIAVLGETVENVGIKTQWDKPAYEQIIMMCGVNGVSIPTPGLSLCSSCGFGLAMALYSSFKDLSGRCFNQVEICTSSDVKASPTTKQVFLIGKCAIAANKDVPNKIEVKGCPPRIVDIQEKLKQHLLVQI